MIINLTDIGAKRGFEFHQVKNPSAKKVYIDGVQFNSSDLLIEAIKTIKETKGFGRIIIDDYLYINPSETIIIPNGVEIYCQSHAIIGTDFEGTLLRFDSQFRTESRVNVYYKPAEKLAYQWWIEKGNTEPRNKTSIGVEFRNCRKNVYDVEVNGFVIGLHAYGYAEGCVENTFNLGDIRNNRYGIKADSDNGGWSMQNYFRGGRIKNDGFRNYDSSQPLESAAIYVNGDGNSFRDINIEGAESGYQYTIYDKKYYNVYGNLRFEKSMGAGQIHFENAGTIIGGTDYAPLQKGKWGKHYGNKQGEDYSQNHGVRGVYIGSGMAYLGNDIFQYEHSVLTIANDDIRGSFLSMQQNDGRIRTRFNQDGSVELKTTPNDWVGGGRDGIIIKEETIFTPKIEIGK